MTHGACTIATARLDIVPLAPRHISERYAGWLNDPERMAFSQHSGRVHTQDTCRAYAADFDHETRCLWAIERRSDHAHVGNINAYLTPAQGVGDIGLLIGQAGQGYGQEAWIGVICALFDHYALRKVTGGCHGDHAAMRQIMGRAAMQPDGVRRHHVLRGTVVVDVVHMAIFAEDFIRPRDVRVASASHWTRDVWHS